MNTKKILGLGLFLLTLLFPMQYCVLQPEDTSNIMGVVWFMLLLAGMFGSYFLIDSANAEAKKNRAGH